MDDLGVALRLVGLVLLIAAPVLLVLDQSAGDCLVLAVVGFGLSRWMLT